MENQNNQPQEKKFNPLAWIILAVVVVMLGAGAYYFLTQTNENTNSANAVATTNTTVNKNTNEAMNANAVSNTNELTNVNTEVDTSDWLTYDNEELSFSFQYPPEYGDVIFKTTDGTTGQRFTGTFSQSDVIVFGGATNDYTFPSEAGILITYGFQEEDAKYYSLFNIESLDNNRKKITPIKIIEAINSNGILVNKSDIYSWPDWSEPDQLSIIFNLPNQDFSGIALLNKDLTKVTQEVFEQVAITFKTQ